MPTADRNPAIDVLRGLTLALMIAVNVSIAESYAQLQHALWHGLTLADVVFPTFLFVVGASLAFTLGGYEQRGEAARSRSSSAAICCTGFHSSASTSQARSSCGRSPRRASSASCSASRSRIAVRR
jgi:hypothetical protein